MSGAMSGANGVSSKVERMREERRQLSGDQTISEAVELWGTIAGRVSVVDGGKLYVRGAIYGDLTVHDGGRVHILGNIAGKLTVKSGAKVIHGGVLGGDAINMGGRLYIEATGKVMGKIKTRSGQTSIDPHADIAE